MPKRVRQESARILNAKRAKISNQKHNQVGVWTNLDQNSCYQFLHNKQQNRSKVASFDFDFTLTKPKTGRKFAQNGDDYVELIPGKIIPKLRKCHEEGYKVVIFTNQGGVQKGKITELAVKERIEQFIRDTEIPINAYVSVRNDQYRKPNPGMWEQMLQDNGDVSVQVEESFYCGDAAGRIKGWGNIKKNKRDFSCSDRKFAHNLSLKFSTPDEYFLGQPVPHKSCWEWRTVDIENMKKKYGGKEPYQSKDLTKAATEVVLFVGWPGCGKSSLAKKLFVKEAGYVWINRDTLGDKKKCVRKTKEYLEKGKSVVVDNTNPDVATRKLYIDVAQQAGVPIRAFYFNVPREIAEHMNMYREYMTEGVRKHVPRVAYATYNKKLVVPSTEEGFQEVKELDFRVDLKDDDLKKFYRHYHKL